MTPDKGCQQNIGKWETDGPVVIDQEVQEKENPTNQTSKTLHFCWGNNLEKRKHICTSQIWPNTGIKENKHV